MNFQKANYSQSSFLEVIQVFWKSSVKIPEMAEFTSQRGFKIDDAKITKDQTMSSSDSLYFRVWPLLVNNPTFWSYISLNPGSINPQRSLLKDHSSWTIPKTTQKPLFQTPNLRIFKPEKFLALLQITNEPSRWYPFWWFYGSVFLLEFCKTAKM